MTTIDLDRYSPYEFTVFETVNPEGDTLKAWTQFDSGDLHLTFSLAGETDIDDETYLDTLEKAIAWAEEMGFGALSPDFQADLAWFLAMAKNITTVQIPGEGSDCGTCGYNFEELEAMFVPAFEKDGIAYPAYLDLQMQVGCYGGATFRGALPHKKAEALQVIDQAPAMFSDRELWKLRDLVAAT